MAEVKNTFLKSRMNKDLDDRIIPNGEYKNAVNVSVNKSEGDDIGSLQTVLGNESVFNIETYTGETGLKVIGSFADEFGNKIYSFVTNNTIEEYVADGGVKTLSITNDGTGYSSLNNVATTYSGTGTGLTVDITAGAGLVTAVSINCFGSGYSVNDILTISGGGNDSTVTIGSLLSNYSALICYDILTANQSTIVEGSWLNFSTLYPMHGINLLEQLMFFTDNRNQPRKVNINNPENYYTQEYQISVAKYYPYLAMELFRPSEVTGSVVTTQQTTQLVDNSNVVTLSDPLTDIVQGQGVLGVGVLENTYVLAIGPRATASASGSLVVLTSSQIQLNQKQVSIANSTVLSFVSPETTMYDVVDQWLPGIGYANLTTTAVSASNTFDVDIDTIDGYEYWIGLQVWQQNTVTGVWDTLKDDTTGSPVTVVNIAEDSATPPTLVTVTLAVGETVTIGVTTPFSSRLAFAKANPYYQTSYEGDPSYLDDKFVRFSYRFKFDDGELSLIAPFTQPAFIPQQDGYFISKSQEEQAFKSTEVSFMQNKVNKILLNVPLPTSASNVNSLFKITEIDILYKESNSQAIKVLDSVPVQGNISGSDNFYIYEYGAKDPYKTLPSSAITRVYDKVPVKALSQELISNRIVYGNFQDKHTPPGFLNYKVAANIKKSFNTLYDYSSGIEYPNSTLKQNRTYQVGVVLADIQGRQSTVILSETNIGGVQSFLNSTVYSKYRSEFSANDGEGDNVVFDGNSLKIQWEGVISGNYSGSPGLFNGDKASENYNPLGWYSYKIVVKQTEQDYYNAYLPGIMAAYPLDPSEELGTTSHIVLINDNINKIPRDLSEVGPTQKQFRSSVRLWARVATLGGIDLPFYPDRTSDIASAIGGIADLFGNTLTIGQQFYIKTVNAEPTEIPYSALATLDSEITSGVPSIPSTFFSNGFNVSATKVFYQQESDPLIARISTQKRVGGVVTTTGLTGDLPKLRITNFGVKNFLNVYEIEPTTSLLDIYWESTTSGLISELNDLINDSATAGITGIDGWNNFILKENDLIDDVIITSFYPVKFGGVEIASNSFDQSSFLVEDLNGLDVTEKFKVVEIPATTPPRYKLQIKAPTGFGAAGSQFVHRYDSNANDFKFYLTFSAPDVSNFTEIKTGSLTNIAPSITAPTNDPLNLGSVTSNAAAFLQEFTGENGSSTLSLKSTDIQWSLSNGTKDGVAFNFATPPFTNNFFLTDAGSSSQNLNGAKVDLNKVTNLPNADYAFKVNITDSGNLVATTDVTITSSNATPRPVWSNGATMETTQVDADGEITGSVEIFEDTTFNISNHWHSQTQGGNTAWESFAQLFISVSVYPAQDWDQPATTPIGNFNTTANSDSGPSTSQQNLSRTGSITGTNPNVGVKYSYKIKALSTVNPPTVSGATVRVVASSFTTP